MKKTIFEYDDIQLVADNIGGVIELRKFLDGEEVAVMYFSSPEAKAFVDFVNEQENK